jgi:hypothetical protein
MLRFTNRCEVNKDIRRNRHILYQLPSYKIFGGTCKDDLKEKDVAESKLI